MRAALFYTVLRLGLFIVVFGLLYAVGASGFLLLALAILISGIISYFALNSQRTAMAGVIGRKVTDFREQMDAGTKAEDDD